MASGILLPHLVPLLTALLFAIVAASPSNMYPFSCGISSPQCDAVLYHSNNAASNLQKSQIASFYNVNASQVNATTRGSNQDYLITVPCSCQDVNGTVGYFYDAKYKVQPNDTFFEVSDKIYSGQVWPVGDEQGAFIAGEEVPIHLLCGCAGNKFKNVVTYTVEEHDTLSDIATLLSSNEEDIVNMNVMLLRNASFVDVGWVLFVPSLNL